jgi:DNA-binding transcriptional regulator YhcF (GntR family)
MLKNDSKVNYMTVPAALRELEKIEIIRMPTGRYRMAHAVTATQKAILSAFGVDSDWVREQASSIADMLENQTEQ